MSFAQPWWFLLYPIAALIGMLYLKSGKQGLLVPSLLLWSHLGQGRERFLWLKSVCFWLSLCFMVLALSRPQSGTTKSMQVTEGIAMQMLVDISSSMDMSLAMPDGSHQTRMDVAKTLVEKFIKGDGDELNGRTNDRIGLITFARYADTRSPLTFGHDALVQIVRDLEIQDRANEDGTAYGDALALAAARLNELGKRESSAQKSFLDEVASKVIILLTDGENNSGNHLPLEAAGLAKKWDCKVYCISLGDPLPQSEAGSPSSLTPSEQILEHICVQTGGIFRKAFDYESLQSVYSEIDKLEPSKITSKNYIRIAEWFWFPLLIALGLMFIYMTLDSTWLRIVK